MVVDQKGTFKYPVDGLWYFKMGKYEVTNAEYASFLNESPQTGIVIALSSMSAGMARKLSQIVWVERFRLKPSGNLPGIRQVRKPEHTRLFVEGTLRWTSSAAVVLQEHIAHPG